MHDPTARTGLDAETVAVRGVDPSASSDRRPGGPSQAGPPGRYPGPGFTDRERPGAGRPGPVPAGPVPPGGVPPGSDGSSGGPRSPKRRWLIVAAIVVVVLLAGGAIGAYVATLSTPSYEPLASSGPDPFTAPVGVDDAAVVPAADVTGTQAGDRPNLYAADPARPSCDASALITALDADPARATAWAGVLGTRPDRIPALVGSLTPVALRSPTAVIDHSFTDGAATATPAVLAVGTAVFIDPHGTPVVRCVSGNPLTVPGPDDVPSDATVIRRSGTPIATQTFLDPATGRSVTTPGKADPPVSGQYDYDGTVLLSDGRILNPDGSVRPLAAPVPMPPGSHVNPDGSVTEPDGTIVSPDGTVRRPIVVPPGTITTPLGIQVPVPGFTINPDGTTTPPTPGARVVWNYDGTATVISATGGHVDVWGKNGNFASRYDLKPGERADADGSITRADGTIADPDGSTGRAPVTLPGGRTLTPNGGHDPTQPAAAGTDPDASPVAGGGSTGQPCTGAAGAHSRSRQTCTDSTRPGSTTDGTGTGGSTTGGSGTTGSGSGGSGDSTSSGSSGTSSGGSTSGGSSSGSHGG